MQYATQQNAAMKMEEKFKRKQILFIFFFKKVIVKC